MVFLFLCLYLRLYDIIFSHMDNVQKQRGSIVLYKEERNGADYIRIEYVNSQAVALLLAQDTDVEKAGNSSAYMPATAFKLPDFYDRYSPHAYIDYSRVYVRHPKPKREYTLPKGYLELLEQKRYSLSTIKAYKIYFSDFMEYHKGQDLDLLTVEDINSYMLHMVKEKHISATQQNMRINAIKFYYEKVRKGKRQYYGGIARAKEYKALPEVLSREEMKSIFAQLSNRKHRCMISLIYSAGLRRSELLNLTPQDIISERMLIRIAGKGITYQSDLQKERGTCFTVYPDMKLKDSSIKQNFFVLDSIEYGDGIIFRERVLDKVLNLYRPEIYKLSDYSKIWNNRGNYLYGNELMIVK